MSHRFSTVRMAGLIVVLDGAKLVESGSHEELMAKGGQVTIDRGLLDELRAEVTQVKASLQGQKP